jgi:hypothetical protein
MEAVSTSETSVNFYQVHTDTGLIRVFHLFIISFTLPSGSIKGRGFLD